MHSQIHFVPFHSLPYARFKAGSRRQGHMPLTPPKLPVSGESYERLGRGSCLVSLDRGGDTTETEITRTLAEHGDIGLFGMFWYGERELRFLCGVVSLYIMPFVGLPEVTVSQFRVRG